ncbi:class I SAM-dependent methyltransferase [Streptomyces sp. KHY 26]|uniref:class I SAM-dependent methyltransferase n=1 Tax=Streptomyces sp. KHY 26 TaxID=3097359 RepID=UPI00376ECFBB
MADIDTGALYERFPYPSPEVEGALIRDTAIAIALLLEDDRLQNWRVLDLGCGTGHRLVALALQYPDAQFTGIDPSKRSLDVARELADRNGVTNVRFVHGAIPELVLPETFDLIVSTGVLHHIPRPEEGVRWAVEHLVADGLFYLWLYGALGEHSRMLDRELVHLLAGESGDGPDLETVRALGLKLSRTRYGATSEGGGATQRVQSSLDADAYLNPIVQPLTFAEVADLFHGLPVDWVAAFGVNVEDEGKLIDLGGLDGDSMFSVSPESLFDDAELRKRFDALRPLDRARALELRLRPTGISVVAGRGSSLEDCVPRMRGNILVRPSGAPDV